MVISLCTANNTITLSIILSNPATKHTVVSSYMNMEIQLITWLKKQIPYCCYGVEKILWSEFNAYKYNIVLWL